MVMDYLTKMVACAAIILLSSFSLTLKAQLPKFGDISDKELDMTEYPDDPEASAVVLYESGELEFNAQYELVMNYRTRIKIINEEGYDHAEESFTYSDDAGQYVRLIKGHTFIRRANGKKKKIKLDKDQIFDEEVVDGIKRLRFTMPALQPGAIVEYSYQVILGHPDNVPDWRFQKSIPVAYSRMKFRQPAYFTYSVFLKGNLQLSDSEISDYSNRLGNGREFTWEMKQIPALKSQPYITTLENFRSVLKFQLADIRIPGQLTENYLKEWKDIHEGLKQNWSFWGQFKSDGDLRDKAIELSSTHESDEAKIQSVYDFISQEFEWNGVNDFLVDDGIKDIFESRTGSSSELNLLLAQMLRELDYDANPVLISTRDHGYMNPQNVLLTQFNNVVIRVDLDEQTYYLLDATEGGRPITLLPEKDYNGAGLLIKRGEYQWFDIPLKESSSVMYSFNGVVDKGGYLSGTLDGQSSGYYAVNGRHRVHSEGGDEYVKAVLRSAIDPEIDSVTVMNAEDNQADFGFTASLGKIRSHGTQVSGEYIYLNPMMIFYREENPFNAENRTLPVEYEYPFKHTFVANIAVPEGYTVEELPEPKVLKLPYDAGAMKRIVQDMGGQISLMYQFELNNTTFSPEAYPYLKEMYRQVIESQGEMIVLVQNKTAPE